MLDGFIHDGAGGIKCGPRCAFGVFGLAVNELVESGGNFCVGDKGLDELLFAVLNLIDYCVKHDFLLFGLVCIALQYLVLCCSTADFPSVFGKIDPEVVNTLSIKQGDDMELVLALVLAAVVGALVYFNRSARSLDINQDGKIDAKDAAKALDNVKDGVKEAVEKVNVSVTKTAVASRAKKSTAKAAAIKQKPNQK